MRVVNAAPAAHVPRRLSLRAKGVIACVLLFAYVISVGSYVTYERGRLAQIVDQLHGVRSRHEMLIDVNGGITHSIVTLQALLENSRSMGAQLINVQLEIAAFSPELLVLKSLYPTIGSETEAFQAQSARLASKVTPAQLVSLRDTEQRLVDTLEHIARAVELKYNVMRDRYVALNRYITLFVTTMNMSGLAVFGALAALFLSRLSRDVKSLERRATAIVNGYRGPPFDVHRHDEVGALMEALNRMQLELRQREQQQEISRQQRFHQEKMAAVGSLAATIAHEVSNPINSISGIAQHTMEALRSHERLDEETLAANAELTLKQTERIGLIMRRLADLSAPRSPDAEPIDVNELVRLTCSFIRYDRRLRNVELVLELDAHLPAVQAVADHLTQILMNLLINAADALEGRGGAVKPTVRVCTRQTKNEVILSVADNGQGMDPAVLAHAFEEAFTTKPAAKGRGIGLYLCKTLIEEIGGRIELESRLGAGTTARVCMPLRPEQTALAA